MSENKIEKAVKLIKDLSQEDYKRLKRSFGIGLYLFNLLKESLEPSYLEMLRDFDKLPFEKKKAILKVIGDRLRHPLPILEVDFSNVEKKPIEAFFKHVDKLKTLDEKEKKTLKAFGIKDLYSALWFAPLRYEDRRLIYTVKTTKPGQKVALKVKVVATGYNPQEKYPAWVLCEDSTGSLYLRFRYKDERALYRFRKGQELIVYGKIKEFAGEKYMVHPEFLKETEVGRVLPFYYIRVDGELRSISAKKRHERIRNVLYKLSETAKYMPEYLPQWIIKERNFPPIGESLYLLHRPVGFSEEDLNSFSTPFQRRLIYEDLFLFQLSLHLIKSQVKSQPAIALKEPEKHIKEFLAPYPLSSLRLK